MRNCHATNNGPSYHHSVPLRLVIRIKLFLKTTLLTIHWEASGCCLGKEACPSSGSCLLGDEGRPSSGFDPWEAIPSDGGPVAMVTKGSSPWMGEASPLSLGFLPSAFNSLIRGPYGRGETKLHP